MGHPSFVRCPPPFRVEPHGHRLFPPTSRPSGATSRPNACAFILPGRRTEPPSDGIVCRRHRESCQFIEINPSQIVACQRLWNPFDHPTMIDQQKNGIFRIDMEDRFKNPPYLRLDPQFFFQLSVQCLPRFFPLLNLSSRKLPEKPTMGVFPPLGDQDLFLLFDQRSCHNDGLHLFLRSGCGQRASSCLPPSREN
jgi:hypothetical protein